MQAPGEATEKFHSPRHRTGLSADSRLEDPHPVWTVNRSQGFNGMTRVTSRHESISRWHLKIL